MVMVLYRAKTVEINEEWSISIGKRQKVAGINLAAKPRFNKLESKRNGSFEQGKHRKRAKRVFFCWLRFSVYVLLFCLPVNCSEHLWKRSFRH